MSETIEYQLYRLCGGDRSDLDRLLDWFTLAIHPHADGRPRHLALCTRHNGIRFVLVHLLNRLYTHRHCVVDELGAFRDLTGAWYTAQRRGRDAEQLELPTRVAVIEFPSIQRRFEEAVVSSRVPVLLIGGRVDGVPAIEVEADERMLWEVGDTLRRCVTNNADEVDEFRHLLHTRSRLMRPNVRLFAIFFAIRLKMLSVRVLKRMYNPSGPMAARDRDDFRDDMQTAFGWG